MNRPNAVQQIRVWRGLQPVAAAALCIACWWMSAPHSALADPWDEAPIRYADGTPANRVSRLIDRLRSEPDTVTYEAPWGYLKSLLAALEISERSQGLVFSKTSLQRERINPQTPRAVYFNDEVYVGYCQGGEVLEVSVADPQLGAVFYTLDQDPSRPARLTRQGDSCLLCHSSNTTQGVPGHLVRSVYADAGGLPRLSLGSHVIDHTSPLEQRWGGWYVTGEHGGARHLGNLIVDHRSEVETIDNAAGQNLQTLGSRIDSQRYLSGHSDIVALMVLEHQTQVHNLITRANFETRRALHQEGQLNAEMERPAGERWESTTRRIHAVCEPLVRHLLFSGEVALVSPVRGTSGFAEEFSGRGPHDGRGRSLYAMDLQTRMFRYPCSYLIQGDAFAALPPEARQLVLSRIGAVLAGHDASPNFAHLSRADRRAVWEILSETLPDLPDSWPTAAEFAEVAR